MKAFLLEARLEKVKGISLLLQKKEREQKKEEKKVNWVKLQFDGEKDHSFRLMGIHYLSAANQPVTAVLRLLFAFQTETEFTMKSIWIS